MVRDYDDTQVVECGGALLLEARRDYTMAHHIDIIGVDCRNFAQCRMFRSACLACCGRLCHLALVFIQ